MFLQDSCDVTKYKYRVQEYNYRVWIVQSTRVHSRVQLQSTKSTSRVHIYRSTSRVHIYYQGRFTVYIMFKSCVQYQMLFQVQTTNIDVLMFQILFGTTMRWHFYHYLNFFYMYLAYFYLHSLLLLHSFHHLQHFPGYLWLRMRLWWIHWDYH